MGFSFDVNCDMGELDELLADGTQAALIESVTSVNICCNAHAGSESLIRRTIEMARGLKIGAHPGYADRANFGRLVVEMPRENLVSSIHQQLVWFEAQMGGLPVAHVKAHGALYNAAVRDPEIASAIAEGTARWRTDVALMGLAGSPMLGVFLEHGFTVLREGFADRTYEADGTLRSRNLPGALIEDPAAAAVQAVRLFRSGAVDTVCVHSDTPGSVAIARAVRAELERVFRMEL